MGVSMIKELSSANVRSTMQIESQGNDCQACNYMERNDGQGERQLVSEEQYIKFIEDANKKLVGPDTRLEFSIHEGTHKIVVKIINEETNEVIKEIPPEKILDLVAKIWEIVGLFVDKKI
ncbi:flagellar protein FlaG [Calorimonas adulescens]|nr:flagellar protein FlaG [Calorimonas adulescens]